MTETARDERTYESEGHAVVRCTKCRRTSRVDYVTRTKVWAFNGRPASSSTMLVGGREISLGRGYDTKHALAAYVGSVCRACGAAYSYKINVVKGVLVESKPCGSRCMGATGPSCECSCAGANHGAGHGAFS
jgi:hypothetical protein